MYLAQRTITERAALKGTRLLLKLVRLEHGLDPLVYAAPLHLTHSVHIHVPKTAGKSVRKIVYGPDSERLGGHVPARRYRDAWPELFEKYFVFASVRHPLTRLESAYHYLAAGGMHEADRRWAEKHLSEFKGFAQFLRATENPRVRARIMRHQHFIPQNWFVCDENGKSIVDFLVRTESFEADMQGVCRPLNIAFTNCRLNVTNPPNPAGEPGDRETEERCFNLYREDYDILSYGLSPPRPAAPKA